MRPLNEGGVRLPGVAGRGTFVAALREVAGAENAFALTSASKAWNLAGLKALTASSAGLISAYL